MRWLSLLSFHTGEAAYRLKWAHPQPSAAGTSRMFLAGQHYSFWWMAETRRHDSLTTLLGIGAFYAEQAAESITSQHCPVNTPEPTQLRGMEQTLRWLRALRTLHEVHSAYAESIATLLELTMQYSFCHAALIALAKAATEPDPTGLRLRGAYTNFVSNSLFLSGHRLMTMGAKGMRPDFHLAAPAERHHWFQPLILDPCPLTRHACCQAGRSGAKRRAAPQPHCTFLDGGRSPRPNVAAPPRDGV